MDTRFPRPRWYFDYVYWTSVHKRRYCKFYVWFAHHCKLAELAVFLAWSFISISHKLCFTCFDWFMRFGVRCRRVAVDVHRNVTWSWEIMCKLLLCVGYDRSNWMTSCDTSRTVYIWNVFLLIMFGTPSTHHRNYIIRLEGIGFCSLLRCSTSHVPSEPWWSRMVGCMFG